MTAVACVLCDEAVHVQEAIPGPGSYPVHKGCLFATSQTPASGRHL